MVMDLDQVQRKDIDDALERVTLGIDEENLTESPYHYPVTSFRGNNWVRNNAGAFVKYSLAEADSIVFPVEAITSLVYKNIVGITVSFDYTVSTKCVFKNVGMVFADQVGYEVVETVLSGAGHIGVECSLFDFESRGVNTAISEKGFDIVLNFDGVKSNAFVSIRNVTLELSFVNDLMSESDAVVNRVNFQTDFYKTNENILLKIGEVEYPIKLSDLLGTGFYNIDFYTSSYKVQINTNITVTCTVKDIFGNIVPNMELTLLYKGISQGSAITDESGIAHWTFNVGNVGGTFKITVNNKYLFINVSGFKLIKQYSNDHYRLYINEFTKMGRLRVHFEGEPISPGDPEYIVEGFVPTQYCPAHNRVDVMTRNGSLIAGILTNGEVSVTNTTAETIHPTFTALLEWSYEKNDI